MKIYRFILACAVALVAWGSPAAAQDDRPDARYKLISHTITLNADGSTDIRYRKELTLYRNRAITAYADKGETFILYNPDNEELVINESYTLMADGTKVTTPANAFINQLPEQAAHSGRYNSIREMAIVHTALEPNATIVLDYTIKRKNSLVHKVIPIRQDCPVDAFNLTVINNDPRHHTCYLTRNGKTEVVNSRETLSLKKIDENVRDAYMPADADPLAYVMVSSMPQNAPCQIAGSTVAVPEAATVAQDLQEDDNVMHHALSIRNWVVDYIHLNNFSFDLIGRHYGAAQTFKSGSGTAMDKAILMAAMMNTVSIPAYAAWFEISNGEARESAGNALGLAYHEGVCFTVDGTSYVVLPTSKGAPMKYVAFDGKFSKPSFNRQVVAREIPFEAMPLIGNPSPYYRFVVPSESGTFAMQPALLTSVRVAPLKVAAHFEHYRYTVYIPIEMDLAKNLRYSYSIPGVGVMKVSVKQKGHKLIIDRMIDIPEDVVIDPVSQKDTYKEFRRMVQDWEVSRQCYIIRDESKSDIR